MHSSLSDPEVLPAGSLVGDYELLGLIGVGGFARVYRARHRVLRTEVAIKIISRALALDEEASERFVREARAASRILHPSVVRVLGFGTLADGRAFQIMELVEGCSLDEHLAEHDVTVEEALSILGVIANALHAAHAVHIIHRDLKPANVLMGPQGEPRLADFGIAKALEADEDPRMTRTGVTLGTPTYMSPEQALGRSVGVASDIYSFGVVAFELLTGTVPFEGESPFETMLMHVQRDPPRVSERKPAVGTRFDAAIAALLAKHPEDRPTSIESAVATLRDAPAPEAAPAPALPVAATSRMRARIAVAVAIAIAAAIVIVLTRADDPAPNQAALRVAPAPAVVPATRSESTTRAATTPTVPDRPPPVVVAPAPPPRVPAVQKRPRDTAPANPLPPAPAKDSFETPADYQEP